VLSMYNAGFFVKLSMEGRYLVTSQVAELRKHPIIGTKKNQAGNCLL
jgi:hypothetical protein